MKSIVLTGVRRVELRDVPKPALAADNDVLLRTSVVGLCGSDLHYFTADTIAGERIPLPDVLGHEVSAVVEAVGRAVKRLKPGDRVAVDPAVSCGACDQCRSGRPHTCRSLLFLGSPGEKDGALAEFFVMPEANCFAVPEGVSMREAMLVEPFSIALHALSFWLGGPSHSLAVLGSGPIGLSLILAARAAGIAEIDATDPIPERAAAALKAGASWAGDPGRADLDREIETRRPLGYDAVFECCGEQSALDQAVQWLKPGGTLAVVGIPLVERIAFPSAALRRKEIRVQSVRRQNRFVKRALLLLSAKLVDLAFLANRDFPPEEAQAAFETAAARKDGVLKTSIVFE
jgi:L-iditol 2-dehydrogenase